MFTPIFEKDGSRIVLCHDDLTAESADDAWKIGIGALPECMLFGMSFTGDTINLNIPTLHREGQVGSMRILVLTDTLGDENE